MLKDITAIISQPRISESSDGMATFRQIVIIWITKSVHISLNRSNKFANFVCSG